MTDEALTDGSEPLPLDVLDRIDRICDQFEAALARGERPRPEDFLGEVAEPYRSALLSDLRASEANALLGHLPAGGGALTAAWQPGPPDGGPEYRDRFPGDAGDVGQLPPGSARTDAAAEDQPRALHLRCPHCRNPIEVLGVSSEEKVVCPSCGSSFHLASGDLPGSTVTFEPATRHFDRFELREVLGTGAFGTVWKARDPRLDRTVALKIPRTGDLSTPAERDRFLREARAMAQLRHERIVAVHEVGEHDGQPYIVSELVEGGDLAQWLGAKSPTFREAAAWIAELAEALQYAHDRGVIHRDIKPSNLMLDGDGRLHVMDFGLAKRDAGEITMTYDGQILGTPAYMAPEQVEKAHQVDGRADVYSLGVVLYRLLTGELPFRGTIRMLLHQVQHEEPRPPRKLNDRIPRDLETACLKAMAKEPSRRYGSAAELAADLRRYLAGEPIRARPVGDLERAWRRRWRRPALAALRATVALTLLADAYLVLALIAMQRMKPEYHHYLPPFGSEAVHSIPRTAWWVLVFCTAILAVGSLKAASVLRPSREVERT